MSANDVQTRGAPYPKPPEGGSGVQLPREPENKVHIVGVSECGVILAHLLEPWVGFSKALGGYLATVAQGFLSEKNATELVETVMEALREGRKEDKLLRNFAVQIYKLLKSNNVERAERLCKSLIPGASDEQGV